MKLAKSMFGIFNLAGLYIIGLFFLLYKLGFLGPHPVGEHNFGTFFMFAIGLMIAGTICSLALALDIRVGYSLQELSTSEDMSSSESKLLGSK